MLRLEMHVKVGLAGEVSAVVVRRGVGWYSETRQGRGISVRSDHLYLVLFAGGRRFHWPPCSPSKKYLSV
jgi:hypothetical protein